jgi:hypothetical protein
MAKAAAGPGKVVSWKDALAGASARVRRAKLCLDGELLAEIERLTEELSLVQLADQAENRKPQAPALAQRIVELTEQAQASETEFVFQPLGRRPWRDLVAEHPPTDEQKAAGAEYNTDTLPIVAMGRSCIAPADASEESFAELEDDPTINDAQWDRLWFACWAANTGGNGGADIPLSGRAYALARGTETSSASRGTTDSPAASS